MKVVMKTTYATAERCAQPDEVIDLPTVEAKKLIAKGYAVAVEDDKSRRGRGRRGA